MAYWAFFDLLSIGFFSAPATGLSEIEMVLAKNRPCLLGVGTEGIMWL
jgi:hypothetical protein